MNAETKHSGPVDVLAWFDAERELGVKQSAKNPNAGFVDMRDWFAYLSRTAEVRAAVAELIEAANYAYPPGDYSQDAHGYVVRSALDRVGGAK